MKSTAGKKRREFKKEKRSLTSIRYLMRITLIVRIPAISLIETTSERRYPTFD
jgi:hypothetical protein